MKEKHEYSFNMNEISKILWEKLCKENHISHNDRYTVSHQLGDGMKIIGISISVEHNHEQRNK